MHDIVDRQWVAPAITGLGFDATPGTYATWLSAIQDRDEVVLRGLLAERYTQDPSSFPPGLEPASIGGRGLAYLWKKTHLMRYGPGTGVGDSFGPDVMLSLAVAGAMDGAYVEVPLARLGSTRGFLLEGTNLFLQPGDAPKGARLVLDGRSGTVILDATEARLDTADDRCIVAEVSGDWYQALPFDGDFVTFYLERQGPQGPERVLATEHSHLEDDLACLRQAKAWLAREQPHVWSFIRGEVLYVNWTRVPQMESATDPREAYGSIVMNRRADVLGSTAEKMAWICHGLYHEAKHHQFFKTIRGWSTPDKAADDPGSVVLGSPDPRVPCAWKGTPSPRSMPDHLLALQAFIPGLVAVFHALREESALSQWLRDHIEMDMRAVNGAMGALMLGQRHLSSAGVAMFDVIRADYAHHLIPAYQVLDPQGRVALP